jgi:TonB-dependent starch-binding outer membrane protein SusC
MRNVWLIVVPTLLAAACSSSRSANSAPSTGETGAVSTVAGSTMTGTGPMRLPDLLRGRAAGLDVIVAADGSYQLRIRGSNTINQDQQPLVLVDGIEIPVVSLETALAGLTRDDIRQVTVLKDVASTSVYGTRGAGGVILITTKR